MTIYEGALMTVTWLLGRGVSCACGLTWDYDVCDPEWKALSREQAIQRIKRELTMAMSAPQVDTQPIRRLLECLESRSANSARHLLVTTNWDFLVEREMDRMQWDDVPRWLDGNDRSVFHLNGSIEHEVPNEHQSKFVLKHEGVTTRTKSTEVTTAFGKMCWGKIFLVVGMSFEMSADRVLLAALGEHEDLLQVGESTWILVNPDEGALSHTKKDLERALPCATIISKKSGLDQWLDEGAPELIGLGVFNAIEGEMI